MPVNLLSPYTSYKGSAKDLELSKVFQKQSLQWNRCRELGFRYLDDRMHFLSDEGFAEMSVILAASQIHNLTLRASNV